jgi:hypothetical protein
MENSEVAPALLRCGFVVSTTQPSLLEFLVRVFKILRRSGYSRFF